MIEYLHKSISSFGRDRHRVVLFFVLVFLAFFSAYVLNHKIEGDSLLYVNSIEVLKTGVQFIDFIPMMILSTYLGLKLIMLFNFFTNDIAISWLILNSIMYVTMGLFFHALLKRIVKNNQVAFLGTLFLATNYASVAFGMAYMMDIGGWAFYIASLYFSYRYLESEGDEGNKWLYISSAVVGIGGLYKEYAFVAYVIIFGLILFRNWKDWSKIFWKVVVTCLLAFTPFLLMNIYTFIKFDQYTYLDWFLHNQNTYTYQNRPVEFIKSFGSIFNIGWFLFLGGFYILLKRLKEMFLNRNIDKDILFIALIILSSFSVLLWPVVTRVLLITMPVVIIISSLFIKKIKRPFLVVTPILIIYAVLSYLMDAYILDFVNLPF